MATARAQLRIFNDRRDAERALAAAVKELQLEDPVVLGLPRGGVPVASEVARGGPWVRVLALEPGARW